MDEEPGALDEGDVEPDYRYTLANERTFLAWIRTALGLLAGGVAVRQLVEIAEEDDLRNVLALTAIVASVVVTVGGYLRWREVQAAMRADAPLPRAKVVPLVAAGMTLLAVVSLVVVVVG